MVGQKLIYRIVLFCSKVFLKTIAAIRSAWSTPISATTELPYIPTKALLLRVLPFFRLLARIQISLSRIVQHIPLLSRKVHIRFHLPMWARPAIDTKKIIHSYPLKTILVLATVTAIGSSGYFFYQEVLVDLPAATDLSKTDPVVSTKIVDRNGEVLFRLFDEENRTVVSLDTIPDHVIAATIAIEDQDFYSHYGISLRGITRAAIANFQGKPIQGGSTITQQLVKNRLLSSERTLTRKMREALLAILVEREYSKDEILEMYLNQVAYGGATYGIEEAAQKYFGVSVQEIDIAEAALLAGLPAAPSVYSPFGSYPELATARQQEVIRRMVEDEAITPEEGEQALEKQLSYRQDVIDIRAPHFVMYVKKLLADQYGEELLYGGGLTVTTTIDLSVQETAQEIVSQEVDSLEYLKIQNGAALVTNPKTGEILAMVGSTDYFDFEQDGQVNVTVRPRQPGSSIKPLTYAALFSQGYGPETRIIDAPVSYTIPGSPKYAPKNYDGAFHGAVTVREALASSYNIPAVKSLAAVGVDTLITLAEDVGISTWSDRSRFGLSLTLGGGEVLMTELAQVYGVFANNGKLQPLNPVLEITNYKGETLYRNACALNDICARETVLSPQVAAAITSILSDPVARRPAFGALSSLEIPNQEVAVKTGTTNSMRDNWTIGYTTDRVVAVWVGNNDNTPMSYVASGVTGASPIWNEITRSLLSTAEPHQFASNHSASDECPFYASVATSSARRTRSCLPTQFSRLPELKSQDVRMLVGGGMQRTTETQPTQR